jgi:hypothetical protein
MCNQEGGARPVVITNDEPTEAVAVLPFAPGWHAMQGLGREDHGPVVRRLRTWIGL